MKALILLLALTQFAYADSIEVKYQLEAISHDIREIVEGSRDRNEATKRIRFYARERGFKIREAPIAMESNLSPSSSASLFSGGQKRVNIFTGHATDGEDVIPIAGLTKDIWDNGSNFSISVGAGKLFRDGAPADASPADPTSPFVGMITGTYQSGVGPITAGVATNLDETYIVIGTSLHI
jgi:hypothetical protein